MMARDQREERAGGIAEMRSPPPGEMHDLSLSSSPSMVMVVLTSPVGLYARPSPACCGSLDAGMSSGEGSTVEDIELGFAGLGIYGT